MLHDLWHRLGTLLHRRRADADLDEELGFHLDHERAKLERRGLAPTEARRRARVAFGTMSGTIEACRDARGVSLLTDLSRDVRDACRSLRHSPLVTLVALASLTLGIGANTALFSIVDSLLLRPLPVADPGRLVSLDDGSWTNPIWEQIRARQDDLFAGAFAWSDEDFDLSTTGETDLVGGAYASGRMFDVLGIHPARGRLLTEADDVRGGGPSGAVAAISYRVWQQRFGGAPDIVGRTLTVERVPFRIVGVMPRGFFGPDVGRTCDVVIPIGTEPLIRGSSSFLDGRSTWWLNIMARLRPGQTTGQATAALRAVQPQIRDATIPTDWPPAMLARYMGDPLTLGPAATGRSPLRGAYTAPLLIVMAVVAIVLVIACANIASLFLARATARRHEISIRLALGASRWRIARQLLVEALLLAGAGAGLGMVVARWSSRLLVGQFSTWRGTVFLDLALDWRVLAFTAAASTLTALLFGLAPALGATRVDPHEALKDAGRGVAGGRGTLLRHALVVGQVALSVVLLVAAGLFLRTFVSLSSAPLGFSPNRLLVASVNLLPSTASPADRTALVARLREAVARAPGVTSAGASLITPLSGSGWNTAIGDVDVDSRDVMTWVNAVSPDWFATYGIRLVAGRDVTGADRAGAPQVAVVNEAFAQHFFGGASPIGRTIRVRNPSGVEQYEVVGLVTDAAYRHVREGTVRTMYLPLAQQEAAPPGLAITAATTRPPAAIERDVAGALRAVDPSLAFTFRTFGDLVSGDVARERLLALLAGAFGALALVLAAVGLYGVTSYAVSQRRREIGVRVALGARPSGIVRLVAGRVGLLIAGGLAIGGVVALWAARFTAALLFDLEPRDPLTFAAAAAAIVLIGGLAAWLPARRATRIDPATVLRE